VPDAGPQRFHDEAAGFAATGAAAVQDVELCRRVELFLGALAARRGQLVLRNRECPRGMPGEAVRFIP
jgi:hypothetical protein